MALVVMSTSYRGPRCHGMHLHSELLYLDSGGMIVRCKFHARHFNAEKEDQNAEGQFDMIKLFMELKG